MNLTLAQLRTFDCIARLGSFHAAARQLGLAQPSVSQRIRELEASLGTQLFIRRGPRLSLTAEGHALIEQAASLLEAAAAITTRFRTHDPLRGTLRLGVSESFAFICLPDLLRRLQHSYPELRTSVHVGDTAAVGRLLNERKLDIGIVSEPELAPHVQAQSVGTNRLAWIADAALPVPDGVLAPAELARFHLTISPASARLHATAMAWFARANVVPARVSTCNSLSVTMTTILNGVAIGLVPVRVMRDELRRGAVRLLEVAPDIGGHLVWLCHQASEFGPSLGQVLELVRQLIRDTGLFTPAGDYATA